MTPKELVAYLNSDIPLADWGARHNADALPVMEPKLKGALVHHLDQVCKNTQGRYAFLQAVFGVASSKQLSEKQWACLYAWLDPQPHPITHRYEIRKEAQWDAGRLLYELAMQVQTV